MSTMTAGRAGLGIDLCPSQTSSISVGTVNAPGNAGLPSRASSRLQGTLPSRAQASVPTMKSISAMHGLALAEVGDSMVELDICGGGSGFREGQRIALASLTPGGGSKGRPIIPADQSSLTRQGTLLTVGAAPGRNAVELKSLLGNSNARLKSGAAVLPPPGRKVTDVECVVLEQAKPKAKVEVDIVLESNTCVQGSYLKGHVKIHVRGHPRKESAVFLADGKIRVVGFECIPNEDNRHTFYQHTAPLSTITNSLQGLYVSTPDLEGYAEAREGVHILPFAMLLPLEGESGDATGVLHAHSGVTLRYIALMSIKVLDGVTGKRSIAHFYRNCEIWPRLNPSVVLAPTSRPLQATTSKTLFMGGDGEVTLTATLHRLHWIAGQKCFVKVSVVNHTKKTVKCLTLSLVRTTVCFKPHPHLDALPYSHEHASDPDACQTSTTQKQVSESTLEMGQRGSKGHVSAKGWWTGVSPGEDMIFSHFILLPPDALSVARVRLLEVDYTIRVSLNTSSLASDVHVTLPIRIINFLSLDPPPSSPLSLPEASSNHNTTYGNTVELMEAINGAKSHHHRARPVINGIFASDNNLQILDPLIESDETAPPPEVDISARDDSPNSADYDEDCYANEDPDDSFVYRSSDSEGHIYLRDYSDDVVDHAIASARQDPEYGDNPARFSDLYYSSIQEALSCVSGLSDILEIETSTNINEQEGENTDDTPQHLQEPPRTTCSTVTGGSPVPASVPVAYPSRPTRPRGPSSFALRVQEKLQATTSGVVTPLARLDPAFGRDSGEFQEVVDEIPDTKLTAITNAGPGYENSVTSGPGSGLSPQLGNEQDSFGLPPNGAGSAGCVIGSDASGCSVDRTDTTIRTSRLLPTPPSAILLGPSATIPAPPKDLTPRSMSLSLPVDPSPVRPSLQPPGESASGSSVKAKIRELEERMKVERAKEDERENAL